MVSAKSVLIAASFGLLATGSSVGQTASPTPDACVGAPWDAFDFWAGHGMSTPRTMATRPAPISAITRSGASMAAAW
ncbi:hypothetical protein [Maricaulis sp.]|uniref:hypothetical protein n=1 Tax=Maricaulis sp. TaxID=1486257 RepID=UPI002608A19D|nr:hypothetical protein [Maricaulis sp.]MDF1770019.1 hypothetical protein [Maricaulis sp.]